MEIYLPAPDFTNPIQYIHNLRTVVRYVNQQRWHDRHFYEAQFARVIIGGGTSQSFTGRAVEVSVELSFG